MTTDADDIDLMMVDLSQGRKRLQRWDGDLVPWGWTGVKQNVYKCANFGHFRQNTSRLSSRRFLSLRRRGWSWSPTWSTCSGRSWRRMNGEMKMITMTKDIVISITFFQWLYSDFQNKCWKNIFSSSAGGKNRSVSSCSWRPLKWRVTLLLIWWVWSLIWLVLHNL